MKKETSKTKTLVPGRAGAVGSGATGYTLDSLVPLLGTFEENVRTAIYELVSEQELLKRGQRVDSERILQDVPLLLGSSYDILQGLSETQRKKLNIEKHIFAMCLDETLKLRVLYEGHQEVTAVHAGGRAAGRVDERQTVRALRAGRRSLLASLKNGLDEGSLAEAQERAGKASTKKSLVQGSERLIDYVADLIDKASESKRLQLGAFNITDERIADVRQNVTDVRGAMATTTRAGRVEQRKLDIQDGRVLILIERIVRAFRAAQNEDPTILMPELRALAPLFTSRSGKRRPKPTPPKTPTTPKAQKASPEPLALSPMSPPVATPPTEK